MPVDASIEQVTTTPSRKVRRLLGAAVILQGTLLIVLSLIVTSVNLPLARLRIDEEVVLGLGIIVTLLGAVSWKLPVQATMVLASSLFVLIAAFAVSYRPIQPGDFGFSLGNRLRIWQSATEWTESHGRVDPRFGWRNEPNAVAHQVNRDFTVTYHVDADGWRRLPAPPAGTARGEIWFLGCSFTFGAGVEDDEVYVHRLAAKAWPDMQLRNYSISGWGTTNALLALQDQLARRPKPSAVVYAWIDDHRKRNYLRKSWFQRSNAAQIPRFEIDGKEVRWLGLVPGDNANVEDGPALDEIEFKLTAALIRAMVRLCTERGIPFVMLVMQRTGDRVLNDIRGEPGLHVLDVSDLSRAYHPHDGHPTRVWHQMVARAIASDPMLANMTGLPQLLRPDAIAAPPMGSWGLSLDLVNKSGGAVAVTYPARPGLPLRVDFVGSPADEPRKVVLQRPNLAVRQGHVYAFELQARSTGARPFQFLLSEGRPPWANLGLQGALELTPEWKHVRRTFVATRDEPQGTLMLVVGGNVQPVEIADEPIIRELSGAAASEAIAATARPGWKVAAMSPAAATLEHLSPTPTPPFHVRFQNVPNTDIWTIQLQHDALPLKAGQEYAFELRVRAAGPRPLRYAVTQDHAPWDNLGLYGELTLTPDWQTIRRTFTASRDDPSGRLTLALGSSSHAVEIDKVRLLHGEQELVP